MFHAGYLLMVGDTLLMNTVINGNRIQTDILF